MIRSTPRDAGAGSCRAGARYVPLALIALLGVLVGAAPAQHRRAAPPESAPPVTRDLASARDWTVHYELRMKGAQPQRTDDRQVPLPTLSIRARSLSVFLPLIPGTSMSDAYPDELIAFLSADGRVLDDTPNVDAGYQGLSSVFSLNTADLNVDTLVVSMDLNTTCYQTLVDEAAALARPWPEAPWGPELALCLEPQLFIQPQDPHVVELVRRCTAGSARGMKPYILAKRLAAEVLNRTSVSEGPFESAGRLGDQAAGFGDAAIGLISGYRVNGAALAAKAGKGSPYDLSCLYVATLRSAGIPARLVIGYDIDASEKDDPRDSAPVLRAWAEFFLADPLRAPRSAQGGAVRPIAPADGHWVPVDLQAQKNSSSRAPSLSQPWMYFGNHPDFDRLCPIAFHWVPPAECSTAGPPALWGWMEAARLMLVDVQVRLWAIPSVKRGDAPPRRPR